MAPSLHVVLFGAKEGGGYRLVYLALAVVLFVATFVSYGLNVFGVSGGVVFVPGHAALVGLVVAVWVGYRRGGVVFAWLVTYGALLGYLADHYFLGLSHRSLSYRAQAFLEFDGLALLGLEALVIGTVGFLVGAGSYIGLTFVSGYVEDSTAR